MEWQTEYEWDVAHKSPYQRRCGVIAVGLFALAAAVVIVLLKSL
jgi:hypothetical protein